MGDFRYLDIDSQIVYELRNVWEDKKVIHIMYLQSTCIEIARYVISWDTVFNSYSHNMYLQ